MSKMQIKRHCLLIEVMYSEYFFSGVNTPASCSKQAARATPKGSLRLLCAGDTENSKQPEFYVEPKLLFVLQPLAMLVRKMGGATVVQFQSKTAF